MSILPITTAYRNISSAPYVVDEFWVNEQGFTSTASGSNVTLPGLFGQGCTILSCNLISPGNSITNVLGGATVGVYAINNLGGASGSRVLYSALGTGTQAAGAGLGGTLPADSWLTLRNVDNALDTSGKAIGLAVKYTNLTQTQPRGYSGV